MLGSGINPLNPFVGIVHVAERLQTAGGGAGANGDHKTAVLTHPPDALELMRSGDAALDKGDVYLRLRIEKTRLGKVDDVDQTVELQQRLTGVEKSQLTAVAGAEFMHRYFWFHKIYP